MAMGLIKEGDLYELLGEKDYWQLLNNFSQTIRVIHVYNFLPFQRDEVNSMFFQLAKECKSKNIPVTLSKVDRGHHKNTQLMKMFDVEAGDHIVYFLPGSEKKMNYYGPKDRRIIDYLLKLVPKMLEFSTVEQVKDEIMKSFYFEGLVLGAFSDDDVEVKEKFVKLSQDYSNIYKFALIPYSEELNEEFSIEKSSIIACRGPGLISSEDDYYRSVSNFTELDIFDWLKTHFHPNIAYYTKEREPYLSSYIPLVILYLDMSDVYIREHAIETIVIHSKHYFTEEFFEGRRYRWAIADKNANIDELESLGLDYLHLVFIVKDPKGIYVIDELNYRANGELIEDGLLRFYSKYAENAYPKYQKREKTLENGIIVANGRNLHSLVLSKDYDQLIYCFRSQHLNLYYLELFNKDNNIEIVKVNVSKELLMSPFNHNLDEYLLYSQKGRKSSPDLINQPWDKDILKKYIKNKSKQDL